MTSAVAYISCFIRPNLQNNIQTQRPENQWTLPEATHKAGGGFGWVGGGKGLHAQDRGKNGTSWAREANSHDLISRGLVDNRCARLLPNMLCRCSAAVAVLLLCLWVCVYVCVFVYVCLALCPLTVAAGAWVTPQISRLQILLHCETHPNLLLCSWLYLYHVIDVCLLLLFFFPATLYIFHRNEFDFFASSPTKHQHPLTDFSCSG